MEKEQVNYQNIIKLKQVNRDYQANKHIATGWKLLNVLTQNDGDPRGASEYPVYVLGWDKKTEGKKCREWDENGWEIEDPLKDYRDGVPEREPKSDFFA